MDTTGYLLVLFATFVHLCEGISLNSYHWRFKQKVQEHRWQKTKDKLSTSGPQLLTLHAAPSADDILLGGYPDQYLEQPLDHFDAANKGTYSQRHWANTDFWRKPNGPVFLYIGGEGGISSMTVQGGEHVELAKKYGALLLAVEHRYYGQSINDDGLELENMQFLSSQQALADLATFHRYASKKYSLSDKNKWISFGGSYPGSLSAWFRIKYPHLVYGAIASSAPVRAKVDFQGYNNVVRHSLSDPLVNGSKKCVENINKAFRTVDDLMANKEYAKLSKDFNSCEAVTKDEDAIQLASNLADVFMSTVQYNAEMPNHNITGLCNKMTEPGDPYDNLAELNDHFLTATEAKCMDNSWDKFLKQIMNTTIDRSVPGGVGIRQWLYQSCTQFGYFQTCEKNTSCIFSRAMTLESNTIVCQQVFKVTEKDLYRKVDFTNDYYGSNKPAGTRIVFVNGSVDPWHALSVLKDISDTETAIYIPGTAHCANMEGDEPNDPVPLRQARKMTDKQIGEWLDQASKSTNQLH